jgi:hypothetical protein
MALGLPLGGRIPMQLECRPTRDHRGTRAVPRVTVRRFSSDTVSRCAPRGGTLHMALVPFRVTQSLFYMYAVF